MSLIIKFLESFLFLLFIQALGHSGYWSDNRPPFFMIKNFFMIND